MQAPTWDNPELVADVEKDGLGTLDGMRIYCCGPMSGVEHYNFPAFSEAAEDLRERGHIVFSPAEMDQAEGVVPPQNGDKPEDYADFLLRDLSLIARERVTALACLPGWEDSPGAQAEVAFAHALGLEILRYPGLRPITEPTNIATEAMGLVGGDRQEAYGHPRSDFERTAGIINSLFGTSFEPRDIPTLMIAVKLSRTIQSPQKRDSWVDIIGYAITREMVAEREGRPLV